MAFIRIPMVSFTYPLPNSACKVAPLVKYSEYQKRCSLHALADPQEVRTFYFDLLNSGHALGVNMPAMENYQTDMLNFTQPGSAW